MISTGSASKPLVDNCDQHRCLVANGELVVSGSHRPVAFESVDPALDSVALAVVGLVELGRPASARAEIPPVSDAVRRDRDGRFDPPSAQVGAIAAGVVCLVGPDPVRSFARPAEPQPRHSDGFQDRLELRGITPLPGRDHHRQRLLPLLDRQMDLAG